jgi:hypothetical protein
VLVARHQLVVLEHVRPRVEVPPLVLVVGVSTGQVVGFERRLLELVPAEVDASRAGHLVDGADCQVDAVLSNLGLRVDEVLHAVEYLLHGRGLECHPQKGRLVPVGEWAASRPPTTQPF